MIIRVKPLFCAWSQPPQPTASGLLCVPNLQTAEVGVRIGTDPKRHASRGIAELEIIHDETRLRRAMHK